ncbi:hypothetical protein [Weissella halotolerans]|uniref:Uncharacterized protein n=1 Tax=Weissella halotolerans DSM 20190 TaxID=1123500 RepID=A0A0R2FYB2_9LACO|nr:hypothetical protein [Weissella halotolerans]KRN33401.1 hypothetical protein IV68_GL000199 [Weissella halotolerans DSM 20190]
MVGLLLFGLIVLAAWVSVRRLVRTATVSFQERMAPYQKVYSQTRNHHHQTTVFDGEFEEVDSHKVNS